MLKIQMSIREGFAAMTLCCIAFAAFSFGGVYHDVFVAIAFTLLVALAITAVVGSSVVRPYAIGFLIPAIAYLLALLLFGGITVLGGADPDMNLPTTKVVSSMYHTLQKHEHVAASGSGGGLGGGVVSTQTVSRASVLATAHTFFTVLFGWLGAKFAVLLYCSNREVHPKNAG